MKAEQVDIFDDDDDEDEDDDGEDDEEAQLTMSVEISCSLWALDLLTWNWTRWPLLIWKWKIHSMMNYLG